MSKRRLGLLDKLESAWRDCDACALSVRRNRVVHWRGAATAPLLLVGEAPGADEDKRGLPFVGQAGRVLDEMLTAQGLDVTRDVFITNTVACRPPGNRTPTREEVAACLPRRQRLFDIIEPRCVLLLGLTAAQAVAGVTSIGTWRGQELVVRVGPGRPRDCPAVVTWHPSYLLRMRGTEKAAELAGQFRFDVGLAWRMARAKA